MATAGEAARLVDDLGRSLGVPWTEAERAEAIQEAIALVCQVELVWRYPLPDPAGGWRPPEP
ncbi:MAG: hypothetical protein K6V73_09600 [Firmicutes bacterium]|nr:hypothetical protein [Bacillota bacterium]